MPPSENIPSLAGQPDLLTEWQLAFLRLGRVKSEVMGPIAAELSDDDVRALGVHLAPPPPPKSPDGADDAPARTEAGHQFVRENHCGNCRGPANPALNKGGGRG